MRTDTIAGFQNSQSVLEYRVARADTQIVYPMIIQCISVTGWRHDGLVGAHVSPGTTADEMNDIYSRLKTAGGNGIDMWYVVGNYDQHFSSPDVTVWKSYNKMRKSLRKGLGKGKKYLSKNTSRYLSTPHPGGGTESFINVVAQRGATNLVTFKITFGPSTQPRSTVDMDMDFVLL